MPGFGERGRNAKGSRTKVLFLVATKRGKGRAVPFYINNLVKPQKNLFLVARPLRGGGG